MHARWDLRTQKKGKTLHQYHGPGDCPHVRVAERARSVDGRGPLALVHRWH